MPSNYVKWYLHINSYKRSPIPNWYFRWGKRTLRLPSSLQNRQCCFIEVIFFRKVLCWIQVYFATKSYFISIQNMALKKCLLDIFESHIWHQSLNLVWYVILQYFVIKHRLFLNVKKYHEFLNYISKVVKFWYKRTLNIIYYMFYLLVSLHSSTEIWGKLS